MGRSILFFVLLFIIGCGTNPSDREVSESLAPYGGTPHSIPGKVEAENYNEGSAGQAYHDNDETNHGADYRDSTHVDIERRSDASNGHGIGWATAGEWLTYTVVVQESGTYTVEFPVASDKTGGTFHLEMDGENITGPIKVPDTGGWDKLEMIQKEDVQLETGTYVMKLIMDTDGQSGGVGDIDYIHFIKAE